MKSFTKEERRVIARRIFEALCEHYPDRYIALVERPGNTGLAADSAQSPCEIGALSVVRGPN
jgi:hypothetical protein